MFPFPVMLVVMFIMFAVQVSLWQMFPRKTRDIMFANPIFAFVINLAGSGLITVFTGVASFVGLCNLGASVLFGLYAFWYIHHFGIKGLALDWYKILWIVPIFPKLMVVYEKDGNTWRA